jgi:outer membrane protein OmpA-like peptidoglycan-associated protein
MRKIFLRVAVIATLLSLAACGSTGSKSEQGPPPVESATPSWNSSAPKAPSAPEAPEAPEARVTPAAAPKPAVTLAKPDNRDDALAAHMLALQKAGTTLSDEDIGYYMDTHEARFIQLVRDDRVNMLRRGDSLALVISGSDSFASNSARLRPEIHGVLNAIAQVLEEYRDTRIIISGHTDDGGEADYNQQLSERRARAVSHFLIRAGIATNRIVILGYGESLPIVDNNSAEGRATNRRIEILLEPLTHETLAMLPLKKWARIAP